MKIVSVKFISTNSPSVLARADVIFDEFELKGFKVIKDKNNKEYITPPSYPAGSFWRPLFHTSEERWSDIQTTIRKRFNEWQIEQSLDEVYEKT